MKDAHSSAVVRRYHAKLLRFLSACLKSDQEASVLAQETYIRLLLSQTSRTIIVAIFRS
jgi:DNA-directed RNA polymerase specialized sigma24 family protein